MKKEEFEQLDGKIQEYIKYCVEFGIITEENREYILDRLARTKIIPVKDEPYGGRTYIKDDNIIIEICESTLINEAREYNRNQNEHIEETLFHELTHASSLVDTEIVEIMQRLFPEKGEFVNLQTNGYSIVNEYIAQSLAQRIIKKKYNRDNSYQREHKRFVYNENGYLKEEESYSYEYDSDLFFYGEVEEFALKFIESVYGERDIKRLNRDHFSGKFIDKSVEEYSKRKDGINNLYKLYGNMGNIIVGDYYQQGYYGNERHTEWSNIEVFKKSVEEFNKVIEIELNRANSRD